MYLRHKEVHGLFGLHGLLKNLWF